MREIQERPHSLKEVSALLKMSENGAKSWIKDFLPHIYANNIGKRKNIFTHREVVEITSMFFA